MNIVCTIDERYAQHCGVMLCSLFRNNPGADLRVFLITGGLTEGARHKLDRVAAGHGQRLDWRTMENGMLRSAPVSGHISIASYFRILIPRIVPDDVDKVLFLDSDIVVRGPVAGLYDQPLGTHTHAAVATPFSDEDKARLAIPSTSAYFNAGVLLLNVRQWREEGLSDRILKYIDANADRLRFHDQDALNATLHDRWLECRPTWNAQEAFFKDHSALELGVTEDDLREIRTNPRIVHFTGSWKPWAYHQRHPFKREYYKYLAMTPWAGYRPPDTPTLSARLRRLGGRLAPPLVKQVYRRLAVGVRPSAT